MTDQDSSSELANFARRLRSDARYMSYVLAAYQKQENLMDEDLVRELGTLPALVVRLALCKRPVSSSSRFAEEVREIADYTLTDETQLAGILRQVDVLENLAERSAILATPEVEQSQGYPLTGLLTAARDRDESTDESPLTDDESEIEE